MWNNTSVKILVAGSGAACGPFLEAIGSVPGVELAGLLDCACGPASLELARSLGIPLVDDLAAFPGAGDLDLIINAQTDPGHTAHIEAHKPDGAVVLDRAGARLVRFLAGRLGALGQPGLPDHAVSREVDSLAGLESRIVGRSPQVLQMQELIRMVAPTPTTVLLLGETGTGKDLAARSIHLAGNLQDRPFISINCTALTPTLMESELFGYVKGAFTGAEQDKKGLLEEADGGALFLDEIGDMQMELQAKLLRFLQTGEIRRVGSNHTREVNVRIIAATNRDLEAAVEAGQFRRDLFYRFNTFTITLPPLRERKVDIPYLALHFLTKAEAKLNRKLKGISDQALEAMVGYDWPGNIRELENVVERAAILCRNGTVGPEDLALPGAASGCAAPAPTLSGAACGFQSTREQIMDNFEKKELQRYLKMADGNVSKAARLSGIPRRTMYRKLKRHGL